jgi:hypothetical protein
MASHRTQLDDVLDARAEIRKLRARVSETKAALYQATSELAEKAAHDQAKRDLAEKVSSAEEVLVQAELKQGRLPFDPSAGSPKSKRPKRDADSHDEPRSEAI